MPTKRRRRAHHAKPRLTLAQLEFLTGEHQPDANRFERQTLENPCFLGRLETIRQLLAEHGDLVPRGRRLEIEKLIAEREAFLIAHGQPIGGER